MNTNTIREHMEVYGSDGQRVGTVDSFNDSRIKLTKNDPQAGGQHHFIPLDWVDYVDAHVHINKSSDDTMNEWKTQDSSF